jgi:plasmid stability protein
VLLGANHQERIALRPARGSVVSVARISERPCSGRVEQAVDVDLQAPREVQRPFAYLPVQLLALLARGSTNVAQLMVRNVDEAIVRELKKRAARRNHSAEQEHREILEQALLRPKRRSLAEVLRAMPNAGEDADFERRQIDRRV